MSCHESTCTKRVSYSNQTTLILLLCARSMMHVELKEDEPAVRTAVQFFLLKWQAVPFALMIRRVEDVLACTWHTCTRR